MQPGEGAPHLAREEIDELAGREDAEAVRAAQPPRDRRAQGANVGPRGGLHEEMVDLAVVPEALVERPAHLDRPTRRDEHHGGARHAERQRAARGLERDGVAHVDPQVQCEVARDDHRLAPRHRVPHVGRVPAEQRQLPEGGVGEVPRVERVDGDRAAAVMPVGHALPGHRLHPRDRTDLRRQRVVDRCLHEARFDVGGRDGQVGAHGTAEPVDHRLLEAARQHPEEQHGSQTDA